jgi:hypothetical protein
MINILESYNELYIRLKTVGLDNLLENDKFDEYGKRALRIIAQLPHPNEIGLGEIRNICKECSRGSLELLFQIAGIGELSREILKIAEETGEYHFEPITELPQYDPESITGMLDWNNNMMLRMSSSINRLLRQSDINLKGRCPFCHGDLVEVIVQNELRLRCKQQIKSDCRNIDWFIQDLQQRKP